MASELYQNITVQGLYDDNNSNPLFGVLGQPLPASGSPAESSAVIIAGLDSDGNLQAFSMTPDGHLNVNASITPPSDNTATGSITSTQTVEVSTSGTSALMVQVSGTWTGTLDFQVSLDGTTFQSVKLYPAIPDGTPSVSSTTTNGNWTLPVGGIQKFQVIGNTVATGSATINLTAGQGQYSVFNFSDNAANFLATSYTNDGSGNPISSTSFGSPAQNALDVWVANSEIPVSQSGAWTVAATQSGAWSVSVTGTVAVTQSTSPWVVTDTVAEGYLETLASTVSSQGSPAVPAVNVYVVNEGGTSTVNQGNQGTIAQSWYVELTDGTNVIGVAAHPLFNNVTEWASVALGAPTAWGMAPTGNVIGVNAELFAGNNALSTTSAGSPAENGLNVYVLGGTVTATISGTITVAGTLSNNTAAPIADNVGVLPAIAQSGTLVAPTPATYTAGNQVLPVVSLGGSQVVIPADEIYAASLSYYSVDAGATYVTLGSGLTPLFSIETNSAAVKFLLRSYQYQTDGSVANFRIIKNGTLTGATYATTVGNAKLDTAATVVSGGTVIASGYAGSDTRYSDALLEAMASGAPGDHFTLAAQKLGTGTSKALGQLGWSEQVISI